MMNILEFIKKRFNPQEKYGLTLTVGTVITLVFIWFFYVVLEDFVSKEFLYLSDLRILNLVKLYRTPSLNQAMLAITYLGKWEVIFLGTFFVSLVLLIQRKWTYLWTLIASVVGGQIIVTIIKNLVDRTRPSLAEALVIENTYSFPSGHSLVAVTFYGFLTYLVFKHLKTRMARFFAVITGLAIIFSIGFSRVYLGVHFPSDVLAGYFIGAAWVTALITAIEVSGIKTDEKKRLFGIKRKTLIVISISLFGLWLAFCAFWTHTHPLPNIQQRHTIRNLTSSDIPANLFDKLPKTSETITGQPMEPINIIVVGSKEQIDKSFKGAGWYSADPVTVRSSLRIAYDTVFKKPYPNAPGTPSFWNSEPNPFAFEKPTGNDPSQRHHIHFWPTNMTVKGTPVWFATAHFDKSVFFKDYVIPTHQIDPNIDAQRATVANDLKNTGEVSASQEFQLVPEGSGKNAAGSLFFTDGKAEIIYLK